ncbi:SDR family NAD(P)-dependent oxidoreductase [Streptomyces sp. NPDC127098]|uniref:SDR family NAD(P)-dependent oxidoreductase n=1 Tax=Streptomyces sp. NPDC127098 TaxID=3347137 RepID=UPI00365D6087
MRIAGATVLVTGAAGGIGGALARRLAAGGAAVVVSGRRADALEPLAAELGARVVAADLADPEQVRRLARECGDVDVLVANAALPGTGDLLEYTPEQIDRALDVNLRAPVMLARLLAPRMVAAGRGHLVFVGSMSGKAATPLSSMYTASKFGLRGFAHGLRLDLRGSGVGVSLVQPGYVRDAGMFAAAGEPTPVSVPTVTPEQVAAAVVGAVEADRGEVNVAPLRLRLLCALAGQFPSLAERGGRRPRGGDVVRRIAEAQRDRR